MSAIQSSKLLLVAFAVSSASAQSLLPVRGEVFIADGDIVAAVPGAVIGGSSAVETAVMDLNGTMLCRAGFAPLAGMIDNTNRFALYYGRSAADRILLVRSGDPEPSRTLSGVTLSTATGNGLGTGYRISPQGSMILFGGSLNGAGIVTTGTAVTGRNDSAIFWGPAGGAHILVRRGDPTPGGGGSLIDSTFTSLSQQATALNSQGIACFQATLAGGDVNGTLNNSAWLLGTPGNLQIMLRKGDLLPGGVVGIGALGFGCQMNDAGQVLHDATLSLSLGSLPATVADDKVLMVYTPGVGNQILMREGDAAAGTGANYGTPTIGSSAFTRSGKVAFTASLTGADVVGTTNDQALFVGTPGNLVMVARKGDQAPGAVPGEVFAGFTSGLQCNDSGAVALVCVLSGPTVTPANDSGIWAGPAGNFWPVARTGDAAPGIAGGVISRISNGSSSPDLNDRGQMIFGCDVLVGGTTTVSAVYGYDQSQGLVLLLQSGDMIPTRVGPQSASAAAGIQFNSGDGCPLALNNNGDFVRRVLFSAGGSAAVRGHLGALTATPAAIPAAGGRQTFELDAGADNKNRFYLLAGTRSGTRPGLPLGPVTLPLNYDLWFQLSLGSLNGLVYSNAMGSLDGQGKATAQFDFPAGYSSFAGNTLHHAFLVIDLGTGQLTFASEAASLLLY